MGEPSQRARWAWLLATVILLAVSGGVVALLTSGGGGERGQRHTLPTGPLPPTASTTTSGLTTSGVGPPAQPPPPGRTFGASVNRVFNDRSYSSGQIAALLEALRRTGATAARSDAFWELSEPSAPVGGTHHYDWAFDDQVAGALAAHGLRWLPIIDYTAYWAESVPNDEHSAPARPEDYAAYAGAFAQRYGSRGTFWHAHPELPSQPVDTYEIWNEPDSPRFWSPALDPTRYIDLYLRARQAIIVAQPSARVIIGGLTIPDLSLPAMLRARPDARGHIDGVAIHPYDKPPLRLLAEMRKDRQLLRSLGLDLAPLYVTEFGWLTQPTGVPHYLPARLRPQYIRQAIAALGRVDCGIAAIFLYTWVTPERNPREGEDWFGIYPPAGGPSADSQAFTTGIREATSGGAPIKLCQ